MCHDYFEKMARLAALSTTVIFENYIPEKIV
jgi:hypothetical protein